MFVLFGCLFALKQYLLIYEKCPKGVPENSSNPFFLHLQSLTVVGAEIQKTLTIYIFFSILLGKVVMQE